MNEWHIFIIIMTAATLPFIFYEKTRKSFSLSQRAAPQMSDWRRRWSVWLRQRLWSACGEPESNIWVWLLLIRKTLEWFDELTSYTYLYWVTISWKVSSTTSRSVGLLRSRGFLEGPAVSGDGQFKLMHLTDAFIQNSLHCIQGTHFIRSCIPDTAMIHNIYNSYWRFLAKTAF